MKNISNSLKAVGLIGLLAMGLGLTGCQSSGERSRAQQWGDRQVASGVKKELSTDTMFKYPNVDAVAHEGTVQLIGFVDVPEQRTRAAQLAANARGVRQVINSISLKPTPTGLEQLNTNAPAIPSPTPPQ